ncbi:hypothetical protein KHQ06_21830 [Nocardia tengchongensis]|uniref:Uncharacterized protein n=1 Tax=Nocardia tengchongensis TaxID=2055889 RepID=A0ABX8CGM0_9NOCA|nr:hypothetical protein [Nocardia tengchongensis]QVI19102.1 hypothetical protein KHQ06_21830 [Nocardia tengchongensis]
MTDPSWRLVRADEVIGVLTQGTVDMFWTDCVFEPGPGWPDLQPLFAASRDAWRRGDQVAASEADETIQALELALVPIDGGPQLTEILIRINGDTARFRY